MIVWTGPALRAEIEYRHEELRKAFGHRSDRRRRGGRRWSRRALDPAAPAVRIPRQRTAGPGERRVPVGCTPGSDAS
jgi:hypothetical protein